MADLLLASPVIDVALGELRKSCEALKKQGISPSMRVILVGDNPASLLYTRNKKKFCEKFGADCDIIKLPLDLKEDQFILEVKKIAEDPSVHGCFVQLPLPKHLQHLDVGSLIPPGKDVDGFHARNINSLFQGDKGAKALLPCTPKGIISLLQHYDIPLSGKNIVVIGRSLIVGRPLALLLNNYDATVTLCHSKTKNLKKLTKAADIIISAVGRPRFLGSEYVRDDQGQVLIDVGINHDHEGKLCGDIDFREVENLVQSLTPVPGGVGPMTILSLAQNLLQAASMRVDL